MPTDYSSLIEQVAGPAIPKAEGIVPPSEPPAPTTAPEQNFDYSALIEQVAGPDSSDADKASQALRDTQGQNPDEAAKRADIAKKLGVAPIFLPKSTPEAAAMLQRQQNEQVAQESPEVAKWVQEHAHLVGDGDLARLATMQRSYSNIDYLGKKIKAGWELAKAGSAKLAQEPFPRMANLAQMGTPALAALGKLAEAALPIFRDTEDLARTAKGDTATFEKLQQQNPLAAYAKEHYAEYEKTLAGISPAQNERFGALEYATTDPNKAAYRSAVKMLGDVFESLPTTAMLALTFALTRGAASTTRMESLLAGDTAAVANLKAIEAAKKVAIWVGGVSEGTVIYGQNSLAAAASVEKRTLEEIAKSPVYQEYLKAGNDPKVAQALAGREVGETVGGIAGVLSGLTAGIGGIFLGKILGGAGGSATGTALRGGATEAAVEGVQSPQEQFTENVVVKAKVDPTQELDQGVLEAAVKGATLGGVTGATFGIAGHSQVDQATRDRDALESLANQTAENPVRGRSPDAMAEFISTMTEGTNLAEVFVDTGVLNEVFNQHGVSLSNIESTLPEVAAQLSDETNADGYVRVSTAELLSRVTNPEVRKAILDNAAASLNEDGTIGMTFLETQTFAQTSQEDFKKEAEKAVARREQAKQHDKDMTEIRQLIKKEIAATGRYDAKVAASHAIPIAEFYRTQAARFEGMTAKQLYEQYPYRAKRGEDGQGLDAGRLAQTGSDAFKSWFEGSKVTDAEGNPLRVYHGTQGDFDTFEIGRPTKNSTIFGSYDAKRTGVFFAEKKEFSDEFAGTGKDKKILETYLYITDPADLTNVYTVSDAFLNTLDANGYNSRLLTNGNLKTWELFDEENGGKEFVAALKKMGYDGAVITENDENREPQKVWIAFEPTQIKSAIGNEGTFDPNNPNILKQGINADFSPADLMSTFYSGANLTSIIHETGHFFLEVLERLATRADAPAGIAEDYAKIMEWFGVTPEQWAAMDINARTPFHEQFAESQELWMLEGQAPSLKMQPLFIRFQQFLLSVYKSAEQFLSQNPSAGKLNDEVRAVFSRLIASEEAIQEAEAVRGYVPLFQTAAQAGMTEDAFTAYLKEHADATQKGVDDMQRAAMRDVKWLPPARNKIIKRIQEEAKAIREKIKAEVTSAVMSEPVNQARHFLRTGELVDPETGDVTKSEVFKLNSKALENAASAKELKGMTDPDGLNPDEVADMFGYQSSDALLYDLLQVENAATKIEGLTDQRMLQEHGEMIDARAIEATANAAITNEARTRFLASGLRILTKSTLPISQMTKAAYIAAENAIKNIRVKDLRPEQFAAAERRANKEALASAAKDPAMAIRAQRAALLNNQLYKAARRAQDEIRKGETHLKSLVKPAAQKAMGGEHILQVNALLDRFGIRSRASLAATTGRRDLASYIADETARLSAVAPDVPGWILSEQASPDYTTLSIGEFRELVGAVNAIEGLARRERNQYNAIRNQTFEQEKVSFLRRLREVHPKLFNANGRLKRIMPDLVSPKKGKRGNEILAALMDIETILDVLEGGKFGPVHESIFGRMSSRDDWKSEKITTLTDIIKPLFMQYSRLERYNFSHKDIGSATVGFGLTRENAVVVALLHGSKEGRDRLANYGWNLATQQKIIDLLEPRDVKLVNGVWSLFDNTLWPELRALNERTRGKAPPKVEAIPHTARGGQLTGGYFKLKYSNENNVAPIQGRGAIRGFLDGETGSGRPTTAQGSSQARVEESDKEPRLDFGVFFETMNETVHDLAYREAVADTFRVLEDSEIQMAIKAASSPQEYEALVNRVSATAVRPQHQDSPLEKGLTLARKNTVVVLMSGIYTAMQNYLNFIPLTEHVGKASIIKELARMHSPMGFAAYSFAVDNSVYLRNRHLSYDRALQEDAKTLTTDESFMPAMSTWLWAMGVTDKIVSATGWNAAYKEAMKEFGNDHERAVAKADHVVRRTMGSGREVDISPMQEGPHRQVWNMFYSFASSQLNLLIRAHRLGKREWNEGERIKATTRIMKAYFRVVILPAVFNDLVITALRGDTGEDEPEDWAGRLSRDSGLYALSMVPGVRIIAPFIWRLFDDKLPSYGLKMTPIESSVESVAYSIPSAIELFKDEGDIKDVGNVIMGVSILTRTPGLLVKNAVLGADAIAEDTAGPAALLVGPPKERR